MFVFRFQYTNGMGIYNHGMQNTNSITKADHIRHMLLRYDKYTYDKYGKLCHPEFTKILSKEKVFGFDTIEKFNNWFPEKLLIDIIKNKSKRLKFCVFNAYKYDVASDKNQCQFTLKKAKPIIKCNMGCVTL